MSGRIEPSGDDGAHRASGNGGRKSQLGENE
jgi:hypothetical protein